MAKLTIAEARQKYSQKCYELGDLEFKLANLPNEISTMHTQLKAAFNDLVKATREENKISPPPIPEKIELKESEPKEVSP